MRSKVWFGAWAISWQVAAAAESGIPAPPISIRRVADTQTAVPGGAGNFTFFDNIAMHGNLVAFRGNNNNSNQVGLFIGNGVSVSVLANRNTAIPGFAGNFSGFGEVVLNSGSACFFGAAEPNSSHTGIYRRTSGGLNVVVDELTPIPGAAGTFQSLGLSPSINSSGGVAFQGSNNAGLHGIYRQSEGVLERVADTTTPIPSGTGAFISFQGQAARGDGQVSFIGSGASPAQQGVYTTSAGGLTRIANRSTLRPSGAGFFLSFAGVGMDAERIGFWANGNFAGSSFQGIYSADQGVISAVVETGVSIPDGVGSFTTLGTRPSLDGDATAFSGTGSGGQIGLYMSVAGDLFKVIDRSDTLDGKSINSVFVNREGLDWPHLAFGVNFTDGSQGVYLATVPEPGALVYAGGMAFACAITRPCRGIQSRRSSRRK